MKLTFEIQGYNITIEETEEGIVVAAMQGDEEVESFTLDMGGEDDMDMDDDMGGEDLDAQGGEDLDAQSLPDTDEIGGGDEFAQGPEGKLESFMSFIKKRSN